MNIVNAERPFIPELQFILKVESRCNLNCSYCYVYNKGDSSWRERPVVMSSEVLSASLNRIKVHCQGSRQETVRITFHGGEPTLVGPEIFARWCEAAYQTLDGVCRLRLSIQTNGTLIDEHWIELFKRYEVSVGLSLDGPRSIHDKSRVDHAGHGSYDKAVRGLDLLRDHDVQFQVLCVIQFGVDSLPIHRHLLELGAKRINYLLPDFTHDTIAPIRALYGPTPCADYLMPILEDWWANGTLDVKIGLFWNMARVILGGDSQIDLFGNGCYQYVFVETNGDIEGLDVLKICGGGLSTTQLHVFRDDFIAIGDRSPLHRAVIFEGMMLPQACRKCPEVSTCSGGYLPHRYSKSSIFDNPTIWCEDMLRLFGRMREMLDVSIEETGMRRLILEEIKTHAS